MGILPVFLAAVCALAGTGMVNTDTFCSVDREIAGLIDSWIALPREDSGGLLSAGIALQRAEAAYAAAAEEETGNLPEEVSLRWSSYLKASADCIAAFRTAVSGAGNPGTEDILIASFNRWVTRGEEFLNSVQSTR